MTVYVFLDKMFFVFFVCDLLNLSSSYSDVCDFFCFFVTDMIHDPKQDVIWVSKPKQLYHGENKLIFNKMMMRSALY